MRRHPSQNPKDNSEMLMLTERSLPKQKWEKFDNRILTTTELVTSCSVGSSDRMVSEEGRDCRPSVQSYWKILRPLMTFMRIFGVDISLGIKPQLRYCRWITTIYPFLLVCVHMVCLTFPEPKRKATNSNETSVGTEDKARSLNQYINWANLIVGDLGVHLGLLYFLNWRWPQLRSSIKKMEQELNPDGQIYNKLCCTTIIAAIYTIVTVS